MANKHFIAIVASFVIGTAYYYMMSASIPKGVNCSFSANVWTDVGAFLVGAWLLYSGVQHDDATLTFCGATIITEHVWQLLFNKVPL
jgi:hypothetical protein